MQPAKEGKEQPKVGAQKGASSIWLWAFIVGGLAVLIYFLVDPIEVQKFLASHSDAPGYYVVGKVPVVEWNSNRKFANEISKARKPVILRGASPGKWPAVSLWTPAYLSKKVETLQGVYVHKEKTFTFYDDEKPYVDFEGIHRDLLSSHKITDMKTSAFFEQARKASLNQTADTYYYYSGPLSDFEAISKDLKEIDLLRTSDGKEAFFSIWIGYNGTTAHTHYDIFNNFNLQLHGRKQFILTPPDQWDKLYPYPRHHPSYRQSQVDFDNPDMSKFPSFKGVEAYETILEPGDILYLPPYWGHRVTALETSISVNAFSDSTETLAYYEILKVPLVFAHELPEGSIRAKVLRLFFQRLVELSFKQDAGHFIRELFRVRYSALDEILSSEENLADCGHERELPQKTVRAINETVTAVSKSFKKIPRPIRAISVGNYIEDLIKMFLGAGNVAFFLKNC